MDASQQLAEYFESVNEQCNRDPSGRPTNLPEHDRIIYYVISTRCEIDMNGFNSVFDQLLTESELCFLIDALEQLGVPQMAGWFDRARFRLRRAGFFDNDSMRVSDLDKDESGLLDDIEEEIRNNDSLWGLDECLVDLIPKNNK